MVGNKSPKGINRFPLSFFGGSGRDWIVTVLETVGGTFTEVTALFSDNDIDEDWDGIRAQSAVTVCTSF